MRHVEISTKALGRSPASIYQRLCDFAKYPEYTSTVRAVDIITLDADRMISHWEVNFNRGILKWTEEDHFNPAAYSIDFRQTDGDIDHFSGQWILHDEEDACIISFAADFDLGIPSLADMLEPIAERVLRENIHAILEGLLAQPAELSSNSPTTQR